jgi:hypothetical protein
MPVYEVHLQSPNKRRLTVYTGSSSSHARSAAAMFSLEERSTTVVLECLPDGDTRTMCAFHNGQLTQPN